MYTQTKTIPSKKSPGAIILTAVIAAWLITAQHMFLSIHDTRSMPAYAQEDLQWSIVYLESGYSTSWLLDGLSATSGSTTGWWIDALIHGVGEMRDDMMSLIPDRPLVESDTQSGNISSSWTRTQEISPLPVVVDQIVHCEQGPLPSDINATNEAIMKRSLSHCLIEVDDNGTVMPDTLLTHDMMLIVADRAWFDVDLNRWSSQIVSREDLKRFLDYLLFSKQIDGVPAKIYNKNITKKEYLTLLHDIIPDSMVLPEATMTAITPTPISYPSASGTLTVAVFKQQLNTRLTTPMPIMSYDATVIATPAIQQSILLDLINQSMTTIVPTHGAATTMIDTLSTQATQWGIGLNTETLKSLLWWLIKEI